MRRLLLVVAALLLFPAAAAAQRSLAIKRFEAGIVVNVDGTVDVTETITVEFHGRWNGIYRTVPVRYRNPQGFSWSLRLEDVRATEAGSDAALRMEQSREGHFLKFKIWVPGAEDATRTVVFRYRALNGLRFFEDHDELYWNVTGDEWDVPIESAEATIRLPAAASGVRAIAFTGAYGSTAQDAVVSVEGTTVRVLRAAPLGFHEGVTAVVGWNKGVVAEPTATDRVTGFLASNWPLLLPVGVFVAMLLLWIRVGRDPASRPVVARYEPPDGMTPAEAGTLLDERVDMRDITATVVNLGVGGRLRIEEREASKLFGLLSSTDYAFHRLDPPAGAPPLAPHEQEVLDGIFSSGAPEVSLSALENEFYAFLPGIRAAVYNKLVERGLYRTRPDRVKALWTVAGVVLGFAMSFVGIAIGAGRLGMSPLPFILGAILTVLVIIGFGRVMPARTVAGARAWEAVRGFEEFLRRVDGDQYQRVVRTPEMFERFLPFAMTFGVEKKWAAAFADIVREPPSWYVGPGSMRFSVSDFSGRLGALSTRASSTLGSSPRSSGGSGFGGGGSSGGGGGGGGGGGF